jgi:hypothetical protein
LKKIISFFLVLLSFFESYSQKKYYNIQVALGINVRSNIRSYGKYKNFYPFYSNTSSPTKYQFALDVKKNFLKDKLTVQLSNIVTHGLLRRGNDPYGNRFDEKSLRRDHFIDFMYTKKSKGKYPSLLFGAGYGVMNAGTNFIYSKPYNNNPANISVPGTLQLMAPRIIFGLEKGVFNTFLIANYTGRDDEYNKTPAFNVDIKLTITFPKFEKISKKNK